MTVLGECGDDTHKSRSVIKFVFLPTLTKLFLLVADLSRRLCCFSPCLCYTRDVAHLSELIVARDARSLFICLCTRKGGQDDYVMQSFQNYIDRLGLVRAELKCDQEPSTLDVANTLIKQCQSTILMLTATPKGSKGSLGRGERAHLTIQGQLRAFREDVTMRYKTEIGPDHVLMGWMVRHCAWVVNNFQVKGTGRTPYGSIRCKDYTGEVMPFGEICLGRNHSEDGAKLNMRWMRGVFVGKLDRTDEFLLLTPTSAMKTRCVRRLEGDNAWDLQFLNLCVGKSVECNSKEHAADTNNPTKG